MKSFIVIRYFSRQLTVIRKAGVSGLLAIWVFLISALTACESDPYGTGWDNDVPLTISQYLEKNKVEYSKFHKLVTDGKMLGALYAYNPHGEGYTLFLPTDEAIDRFIQQNQKYGSFEELLKDTGFIKMLTRYHTLNRKVKSDEFPDGALKDLTLTGDRLVIGFYTDGNNQIIRVNNAAPVIKANIKLSNGYIHVVSGVLEQAKVLGYDWLQEQSSYSILANAVRLSGLRNRLWWNKYTILAEHDSIYHRMGIRNVDDLIQRIATPGMPLTNTNNTFYLYTAYHFLGGDLYLNDFNWGNSNYATLAGKPLTVSVGVDIKINPGVDTYGFKISESRDTTVIDYISPVWEYSNILTRTGPVHSISELLFYEQFPKN